MFILQPWTLSAVVLVLTCATQSQFPTAESYRVEGSQPETLSRAKNTTLDLHLVKMNPNKSDTPLLTKHSCSTAEPSVSSSARRGSLHGRVTGGGGMEPPSTAARQRRNHNSLDLRRPRRGFDNEGHGSGAGGSFSKRRSLPKNGLFHFSDNQAAAGASERCTLPKARFPG